MPIAFTRAVSATIDQCELTHMAREPIDAVRAQTEHAAYEAALTALGCTVQRLPPLPHHPDAVFVEDTAVILPEVAIITRPGALSRRAETESVAAALAAYRPLRVIEPPGTLDGGDVLVMGKQIFVGAGGRSNEDGIGQLRVLLARYGYTITAVPLRGCLHLKTAVTQVAAGTLLLNPDWIDPTFFAHFDTIATDPAEPFAANALLLEQCLIFPERYTRTQQRLAAHGIATYPVPAAELAKAEGGLTCCSLIVPDGDN